MIYYSHSLRILLDRPLYVLLSQVGVISGFKLVGTPYVRQSNPQGATKA